MKNKKLGKILLCTTLALATPFALAACSKNADNNTSDNNEPEIVQPVDDSTKIAYAKEYEGANKDNTTVKTYTEADGVREDLALVILGEADQSQEYAVAEFGQDIWDRVVEAVNTMVENDSDVRLTESHKYIITLDEGVNAKEAYDAYVQLYANDDTVWSDVAAMSLDFKGAEGVYFTSGQDRDVMMDVTYNTTEGKIYISVFSFTSGKMLEVLQSHHD